MTKKVRVLIVDDQVRARSSLRALLATMPEIAGIYEAEGAAGAMQQLERAEPDVVLMDVRMPDTDGFQATHMIKAMKPDINLVILSLYPEYRDDAFAAGADNFLVKGCSSQELLAAVLGKA